MKVWKVTLIENSRMSGSYFEKSLGNITEMIEEMETIPIGINLLDFCGYEISSHEMTEEEYNKLPEFMGF